jgi:hypothetical protein
MQTSTSSKRFGALVLVESERLSRLDGDASSDAIAEAWAPLSTGTEN